MNVKTSMPRIPLKPLHPRPTQQAHLDSPRVWAETLLQQDAAASNNATDADQEARSGDGALKAAAAALRDETHLQENSPDFAAFVERLASGEVGVDANGQVRREEEEEEEKQSLKKKGNPSPSPSHLSCAPRLSASFPPIQLTSESSSSQADEQQPQQQQNFDADGLAAQWSREFAELLYDDMHPSERAISGENLSYVVRGRWLASK